MTEGQILIKLVRLKITTREILREPLSFEAISHAVRQKARKTVPQRIVEPKQGIIACRLTRRLRLPLMASDEERNIVVIGLHARFLADHVANFVI